ncbi:tRNA isopentenyl-2-thiomethyl-A-37 hydroxylase MiaE [Thioalkalivibrio sp. XN8]|uniref:tRNA-(ms[2]io[6]A)-hydroxylase n=1 Tax=Thioalkalivibrio sp. XN8 TaxID=2712863 RepID=UPI0013EC463C|nr:tRNA isopentenyl-2-thiomethyl-A-37 hydroxylase MiaE [Thioalkalivibrio sp. XN8]NGP52452.1 tRNA-(ms[2]io[6]A)-hydroxylase [Thioalkalivibrio sp. XN8]
MVETGAPLIPAALADFLGAPTPVAWVDAAADPDALPLMLVDHANCEKKAASTALAMLFRYEEHDQLTERLSRLAREELRHFEQVRRHMRLRGIGWRRVPASRYASGLADVVRGAEPGRLIDRLIVGAFIEARSCERFALITPRLDDELGRFYAGLLASEARHFEHYLELARGFADADLDARIDQIRAVENRLATEPDTELRFHSGPPKA